MQLVHTNTPAIERLRQCKGFEQVSDEEALQILQTIQSLCQIACKTYLTAEKNDTSPLHTTNEYAQAA